MKLSNVKTLEELKQAKAKFYAEGSEIKKLQSQLRKVPNDQKAALGQKISALKVKAEKAFDHKATEIKQRLISDKMSSEYHDTTLPFARQGSLHPLTIVTNRFRKWFIAHGYFETGGSEIEDDDYNFQRLNIALDHPARAMQDSLYLSKERLLRTHNTGFSARELDQRPNESFSHFTIGKVYRNDEDDSSHSHQFMQADLIAVGNYSLPNLIWTLKSLLSYVLESEVQIRLRPSYFPFTEPSVEVDIFFKEKWIEVLGAGMIHENVLKMAGYTNKMNAFAAGIGIERITMIKYGIDDIRHFYQNDLRFLNQFKGGV